MIAALIKKVVGESLPLSVRLREFYEKHGYQWQAENIIAIRNTEKRNNNTFSDCISIVTDSECVSFICTTVPGTTWTKELLKTYNVSGTGQYCLGFYPNLWTFGQHAGRALMQIGKASWYEDANLDKRQDAGEKVYRETYTHMDIHRRAQDGMATVDTGSAGCIVPRYHADLENILKRLGWVGVTPPDKKFNGFITDSDSFVFARELNQLIKKR